MSLDDYYNDFDSSENESWKGKKQKKLKQNPSGPFCIKNFVYKNTIWDIIIENITYDDFKVTAACDKEVSAKFVESLKRYLELEGFQDAAKKHNLFW